MNQIAFFIQLYNVNIRDVDLKGKEVVEVGCGRGGGASWIAKTYNPKRLTAFDFSKYAIGLARIGILHKRIFQSW